MAPASAQTAYGPMVLAAIEQYTPAAQRLVDDPLALRLLPPATQLLVRACRWRRLRDLVVAGTERTAPGLWASMLCRKRYADDTVAAAVAAGTTQVVVLGAGLDTRAYRLVAPAGARAFETDQPENTTVKIRRVRAALGGLEGVRVIPVDLETDDLAEALAANGFDLARPALFVWEAVTQYLGADAVRRTFSYLSRARAGSALIVTFVRADFLSGTRLYGAPRLHQRMTGPGGLWRFGLDPQDVGAFLREYGWDEREQLGPAEYTQRYLEPAGRDLPVTEIERFVHAVKC